MDASKSIWRYKISYICNAAESMENYLNLTEMGGFRILTAANHIIL